MINPNWTTTTPYNFEAAGNRIYTAAITRMYGWIALGLVTTGAAAAIAYRLGVLDNVGLIGYLLILGVALGLLIAMHLTVRRAPAPVSAVLYLAFTAVMGVAISYIFGAYTNRTIVLAFGVTAGLFTAMSVIGFTTKRDLSRLGPILLFGLFGVVIVSVINIFIGSGILSWIVTLVALPLFLGLVVWQTKEVKELAQQAALDGDDQAARQIAITGAAGLYLSFLNIFLILLRIIQFFSGD